MNPQIHLLEYFYGPFDGLCRIEPEGQPRLLADSCKLDPANTGGKHYVHMYKRKHGKMLYQGVFPVKAAQIG